jgi:hypothetical protein
MKMDEAVANQFEATVDRLARINYVESQIMCAKIELQAMMATNVERLAEGKALAYDEAAFLELIEKYRIHHNAVIEQTT